MEVQYMNSTKGHSGRRKEKGLESSYFLLHTLNPQQPGKPLWEPLGFCGVQFENHCSRIKCSSCGNRLKFKNWIHHLVVGAKHSAPLLVSVLSVPFLADFVKGLHKTHQWKALSPVPGPQEVFDKWEL